MTTEALIKPFFEQLAKQVGQLSSSDLEKLENGSYEVVISFRKKKQPFAKSTNLFGKKVSDEILVDLSEKLMSCPSRESGMALLDDALKTRKELEQLARHLHVHLFKEDKIETVRTKIVEATVGAVLRSEAIRGKKIRM